MANALRAAWLAAGMSLAALALAQTSLQNDAAGEPRAGPPLTRTAKGAPQQQLYRSTRIVGTPLRDARDRKIGEIKDLLLDGRRGEVAYAVVSFREPASAGKLHAVPWQALEPGDEGRYYVLQADRETIIQAPGFDKGKWPDMSDPQWSADTDRYWSRMVGRGASGSNRIDPGASGAGGVR
jgi:hypothetical protein